MESSHSTIRIKEGAPTQVTLPNPPLELSKRKGLTSLVPVYVPLSSERSSILSELNDQQKPIAEIYFIHVALAIQLSLNDWLAKTLNKNSKNLPLRDEATGITVLHIAAKLGNELTLHLLLMNADVLKLLDEVDVRGTSPLIVAAWYGNFAALKRFLELGCQTSTCINDSKKNALHCAAELMDSLFCFELLKYNSRLNFIDAIDDEGYTPLMIAVREGSPCVTLLLRSTANYRYSNTLTGRNIFHLAIVFFQKDTLITLLDSIYDSNIISAVDFNGDTPFMLAIKLKNYDAAKFLIISIPFDKLWQNSENCIQYLIKNDETQLLKLILTSANFDFLGWSDCHGKIPLMYAIEVKNPDYVDEFLSRTERLWHRNPTNGETVLHAAAYASNGQIVEAILKMKEVAYIIDASDFLNRTAYEIVLSNGDQKCYYAFKASGYTIPEFVNSYEESALFIAAKKGNYNIVLNLLLSEKFQGFHHEFPKFTQIELTRAGLQGRIYSSDVFIISGEILDLHDWNNGPNQSYLFKHNNNNDNIFHACVKGANLMCLAFIYKYCVHFNKYWQDIDEPNQDGVTPLLQATMSDKGDMFKFFVQHGAVMTKPDFKGKYPLLLMTTHIKNHHQVLSDLIKECVILEEKTYKKTNISGDDISVSYHILCHDRKHQLSIIEKMFEHLHSETYSDILLNPVLEYLIESQWEIIKTEISIRHYFNVLTIVFIYLYITLDVWPLHQSPDFITYARLPTLILSLISIFLNFPILFTRMTSWSRKICSCNILISPISTIIFMYLESNHLMIVEIASLAVFSGGLSLFTNIFDTSLAYQFSIFYHVFKGIFCNLPIPSILLFTFSTCFFILFHDWSNYSTPLHSFMTTVMLLMQGYSSSVFPYFLPNNHSSITSKKKTFLTFTLLPVKSLIMLAFHTFITLSLLNMLIALIMKHAEQIKEQVDIEVVKIKLEAVCAWESISNFRLYKMLSKYNLQYFMGIFHRNLTHQLEIPLLIHPYQRPLRSFNTNRLIKIAMKQENIPSVDLKFLKEDIGLFKNK